MTSTATAGTRSARIRRVGVSLLLTSGLTISATAAIPGAATAAPDATAPSQFVELKLGSRGPRVVALQRAIIRTGLHLPGGVDGIFGASTERAVKLVQRVNGIPESGVVGPATARALGIGPGSRSRAQPAPAPAAASSNRLARGARGPMVVRLQQALIRAGIRVPGGADGVFGPGTESAVRQFQRAKGLTVSGAVDQRTAAVLGLSGRAPAPTAPSAPKPSGFVELKLGSRGPRVVALQRAIIRTGLHLPGGVDGIFGASTERAVKLVQRVNGIPESGVVGPATARALKLGTKAPAPAPDRAPQPTSGLRVGARGEAVKAIQRALMAKGIYVPGGADGIFGPATQAAVRQFQQRNGLRVTGVVNRRTAKALRRGTDSAPQRSSRYVGLKFGSRGEAVKAVQRALMATGLALRGGADGIFGAATQSALVLFQRTNGLTPTGSVDARTAKLLGLSDTSTPYPTPGTTAPGYAVYNERGARVVALQKALMRAGIAVRGGADGVFGSGTAAAVMAFQRSKGLPATGKVDQATGKALGLAPMDKPAPTPAPSVRLDAKPVEGPCWVGDTWLAPRGGGRLHLGTDIIAGRGQELYAVTTGRIIQVYQDYRGSLSGNGIKIARPDGTYFFYAHMLRRAPGVKVGATVTAGQVVGWVGATGNAVTPHLHLEIHPGGGAAINPYPAVKARGAC